MPVIGYATLPVIPSMEGVSRKLSAQLMVPMEKAGRDAGNAVGRGIADGVKQQAAAVEEATQRIEDARNRQAKTSKDLEVAELRLQELTDSGKAKRSQLAAAEGRVEDARRKNTSAARAAEAATRGLDEASKQLEATNKRASRSVLNFDTRGAERLADSLGRVNNASLAVGALGGGLAALAGTAGVAAGAIGAIGVGAAALAGPALIGVGTVTVGLLGIADAFKAVTAQQASAGADAAAKARTVTAAEKGLESAVRGVTTAERTLTQAKVDATDREKDLTRARKEATDQLESYDLRLEDARISEAEATETLIDAQRDLDAASTDDERRKALIGVQRAQLSVTEAVERNRKLQIEAAAAQSAGVDGAEQVIAAQRGVADANDRVVEAEQGVADAHRNVRDAQSSLSEAMNQSSGSADKAAQAMAELSPNARGFVQAYLGAKPVIDEFGDAVQDAFFMDSAQGFNDMVRNTLPTMKTGMVDVAGSVNGLTKDFAKFWQTPQALSGMEAAFKGTGNLIDGLGPGLQQATTGVLGLATSFEPVSKQIGTSIGGLAGQIGQSFTDAANSGQLTKLFGTFSTVLDGLGQGINPILDGLIEAGNIIGPKLGPLLAQLGTSIGAILPPLAEIGATLIQSLLDSGALPALQNFITALAIGLQPVLPVIADLLVVMLTALTPLIEPLSLIAQEAGGALASSLVAATPLIQLLADTLTFLSPYLPEIAAGLLAFKLGLIGLQIVQGVAAAIQGLTLATGASAAASRSHAIASGVMKVGSVAASAATAVWTGAQWAWTTATGAATAAARSQVVTAGISRAAMLAGTAATVATSAATAVYTGVQWLLNAALTANPIGLVVLALAALAAGIVLAWKNSETFRDIVTGAWDAIQAGAMWLWDHALKPFIDWWLSNFKKAIDIIQGLATKAGEVKTWVTEHLAALIGFVVEMPGRIRTAASGLWDGITDGFKNAINWLISAWNNFRLGFDFTIPVINRKIEFTIDTPDIPLLAGGGIAGRTSAGKLWGPGTGTSDSILGLDGRGVPTARVSAGEGVVKEAAMDNGGATLVTALNAGWVPSPELLHSMLPGYAAGGIVLGGKITRDRYLSELRGIEGAPYDFGAWPGPGKWATDCSGAVAKASNLLAWGDTETGGRFATGNEAEALRARGALPGLGGVDDVNVAWLNGGPGGGHTAATLPGGIGFEMGGRRGNGQFGGTAATAQTLAGATDFAHFPASMFSGAASSAFTATNPPASSTPAGTSGLGWPTTGGGSGSGGAGQKTRLKTFEELGKDFGGIAAKGLLETFGLEDSILADPNKLAGDDGSSVRTSDTGTGTATSTPQTTAPVPPGSTGVGNTGDANSAVPGPTAGAPAAAAAPPPVDPRAGLSGSALYSFDITKVAKDLGLGEAAATIGNAVGLVETDLQMFANSGVPESMSFPHDKVGTDHDSLGLFQQRATWGSVADRMSSTASAGLFYNALGKIAWQSMEPGAAAQAVQRSAYPDRYGQRMTAAAGLVKKTGLFDGGGFLQPGQLAMSLLSKPEPLLPADKWAVAEANIGATDRLVKQMGGAGGGGPRGGDTFIANGYTAGDIATEWQRRQWARTGGYGGRSWS
ncbi:hypothetical protein [Nocardia wallacei]|uniref:hypothetical protein n=1 Tax=Nocardia wallacei TaxID=480035 RepID=UPI002455CCDD|nr:hypothetical protein [Nocardia wallacei]